MMPSARLLQSSLLASVLLAGCGGGVGPSLLPTSGPEPTLVVQPSVLPAATLPAAPVAATPTPHCVNDAAFMEDLTLPDGTEVLPGEVMDKRWLMLNRGECPWGPEYRLVQIGDSRIEGPAVLALYPAVAGGEAVWQVTLVAPQEEGEFISRWRAQAPDGTLFGDEVYVLVVVNASPLTPTPIPTAAAP